MAETASQFIDPAIISDQILPTEPLTNSDIPLFDQLNNTWGYNAFIDSWGTELGGPATDLWQNVKGAIPSQPSRDGQVDWSLINLESKNNPLAPLDLQPADLSSQDGGSGTFTPPSTNSTGFTSPTSYRGSVSHDFLPAKANFTTIDIDNISVDPSSTTVPLQRVPPLPQEVLSTSSATPIPPADSITVSQPAPPEDQKPVKKRRGRKRKILTPAAEQLKREQFLERNRLAAGRCRQKKKEYYDGLQEHKMDLERRNAILREEKANLLTEVGAARSLLREGESCCHTDAVQSVLDRIAAGWWEAQESLEKSFKDCLLTGTGFDAPRDEQDEGGDTDEDEYNADEGAPPPGKKSRTGSIVSEKSAFIARKRAGGGRMIC